MTTLLLVMLGSGAGAAARWWVDQIAYPRLPSPSTEIATSDRCRGISWESRRPIHWENEIPTCAAA